MTLLLPSCPDPRRSRSPPLPFRQSLSRIGYSFSIFHVTQCRLEVIPLTVQLPGLLVFAPPNPLVGTARRSRRSLANVLLLTITLLCMPFIFAQHCSPFIERARVYSLLRPPLAASAAHYLSFTLTR